MALEGDTQQPRAPLSARRESAERRASRRPSACDQAPVVGKPPCFLVESGTNGADAVRAELQRRGWTEARSSTSWNSGGRPFDYAWTNLQERGELAGTADSPGFFGAFVVNRWPQPGLAALCRKDGLATSLSHFYAAHGLDPCEFVPETFVLPAGTTEDSTDWQLFANAFTRAEEEAGGPCLWVLKPVARSMGRGIGVERTLERLQGHWLSQRAASNRQQHGDEAWIAQRYVDWPLLYQGRKCDVRLLVAIEAAPTSGLGFNGYAHSEGGYLRVCARPFSTSETSRAVHVSNVSVRLPGGEFLSYGAIDRATDVGFVERTVPAMHRLARDALLAAAPSISKVFRRSELARQTPPRRVVQLLGLDFVVEANGRPQLLEINPNPNLSTDREQWHRELIEHIVRDLLALSIDGQAARWVLLCGGELDPPPPTVFEPRRRGE